MHGIVVVVVGYLVDLGTSTVVVAVDEDKSPTQNMLKSIVSVR